LVLFGQSLRMRRPRDYVPLTETKKWDISGIVSTHVEDGPNKIFIGGLPPSVTDEQLKPILSRFGPLKAFTLVKDVYTSLPKGYAFFSYRDPDITHSACAGLDGMLIGGKVVSCRLARGNVVITNDSTPTKAQTNAQTPFRYLTMPYPSYATSPAPTLSTTPTKPKDSPENGSPKKISRDSPVLALANMVTSAELEDDKEYLEIVSDIRGECLKYGDVVGCFVPRPADLETQKYLNHTIIIDPNDIGTAFVEYLDVTSCKRAAESLTGRKFSGRIITATVLSEEQWNKKAARTKKFKKKFKEQFRDLRS